MTPKHLLHIEHDTLYTYDIVWDRLVVAQYSTLEKAEMVLAKLLQSIPIQPKED